MERLVTITVSEREREILSALREVPAGQARQLLEEVLDRLVDLVRDPHCAQLQADGAPCQSPVSDCGECVKLKEILDNLREALTGR